MKYCTALTLLFIFVFYSSVQSGFIELENKELPQNETIKFKFAMITPKDAIIGEKTPRVEIHQILEPKENGFVSDLFPDTPFIEVLFYHYTKDGRVGLTDDNGKKVYCCTDELIEQGLCDTKGTVITDGIDSKIVKFKNASEKFSETYIISESGIHYLRYFNCKDGNAGDVIINGDIQWINPFGQLSAELYPLLWFFGCLTIFYLILGFIWLIYSAVFWQQLLMLQNCIAGVIFLGMIECITWYFDFLSYNSNGHFNWGAILIGILSSTLKRTVSRLLVLVVALGYGVVKATLGSDTNRVLLLGFVYFCISGIQQFILTYLREGDNEFFQLLAQTIIFPAALLDTVFYWWIFLSLSRTIQQLTLRKQDVKLRMYKLFFIVLGVSGILTTIIILYESLIVATGSEDAMWDTWWQFQAFWHILYYVILLAIAYIWRPTKNNTRYAYVDTEDIFDSKNMKNLNSDINLGEELNLNFDFGLDNNTSQEELSKMN